MASLHPTSITKTLRALAPADYGATAPTTASQIIDTRGFRFAKFALDFGVMAGTSIACKVQQDSDSAFGSGVDTGVDFTTVTTSNDDALQHVIVDTSKVERYLRLIFTFTSVTASPMAATCELFGPADSLSQDLVPSDSV